ncbi:hypothetical protein MKUB_32810 [Mycobacterium kubicae]|uniref:RecT-like ssDNA binding protein n=1 Tax=Mycobacterium kubicae TaxID=120959 RepID=A0AAX1JBU4_9MYCO|nr:hypothetical protein [Mycobacterium kubicae]MCV7095295.1 hypothetical protein [Mycobacterium kubicae]ORV97415.1 hypothetical protein AWC13_16515 [Mycobacterium kubicae]QNI14365.1 hypothetical protein GAN18_27755 [Mycobacterium kubicae]QPI37887.1 hypothetical protein I2456_27215 [Mycobacterium kubicae]GFG65791.1 hypothetical protein MKUB_32810 [Mycobacterium kubicae]
MTSNEIAERDDSGTLEVFPPARPHSTTAVAVLYEHAEVYNTAWKLAGQLVATTMVPKRFFGRQKQGDATAAILYGSELGLNPIQSLQRVVPIHGMPSLEARTMVGLLKSRGYKVRTVEQSDKSVTVEGVAPDGETASSTWTIERAIQAGYVPMPSSQDSKRRPDIKEDWITTSKTWDGKTTVSIVGNMKYITDPQTMLKAKAQAEVCRELAPDVLMGISYTREELESEDQRQFDREPAPARVQSSRVTEDQIFAEEAPLSSDGIAGDNPPTAEEVRTHQAPAGDVTQESGEGPADPEPSPAEQSETVPEPPAEPSNVSAKVEPAQVKEPETEAKAKSRKIAAKRSTAPAADPDRPKSRMRQALEKRLFTLCGDAGIAGDKDRDGRIAVYRSILERDDVTSTDDLDDVAVGKVADQLYAWSQQEGVLDEQIAGILSDAAREANQAGDAGAPTSEGTE